MARPAKFDRDEAVERALEEIWRDGYGAISVKALSETLGITRSSFYNAFGSREELFDEILARYFSRAPDARLNTDALETSVKRLVTVTVREVCRVRAADPQGRGCLAVNVMAEMASGAPPVEKLSAALDRSVERLTDLLQAGVTSGELDADMNVEATALALKTMIVGVNVTSKMIRDEEQLWSAARATLHGLGLLEEDASA